MPRHSAHRRLRLGAVCQLLVDFLRTCALHVHKLQCWCRALHNEHILQHRAVTSTWCCELRYSCKRRSQCVQHVRASRRYRANYSDHLHKDGHKQSGSTRRALLESGWATPRGLLPVPRLQGSSHYFLQRIGLVAMLRVPSGPDRLCQCQRCAHCGMRNTRTKRAASNTFRDFQKVCGTDRPVYHHCVVNDNWYRLALSLPFRI